MRIKRSPIATWMIWIAAIAVILGLSILAMRPRAWMLSETRRTRVEHDYSFGMLALQSGQTARARRLFESGLSVDPGAYECYYGLSEVALIMGNDAESHLCLSRAIENATNARISGHTIPDLYVRRASLAIYRSRRQSSDALEFCRGAATDLSLAKPLARKDSNMLARIEQTGADLEQRLGELAEDQQDTNAARRHYEAAKRRVDAVRAIIPLGADYASMVQKIDARLSALGTGTTPPAQ